MSESLPTALLVNKAEAAKLLGGISVKTVERMAAQGNFKPIKLGTRTMFSVAALNEFVNRQAGSGEAPKLRIAQG